MNEFYLFCRKLKYYNVLKQCNATTLMNGDAATLDAFELVVKMASH